MVREIPLTKDRVALVDDEDYDRVTRHKWQLTPSNRTDYAGRRVNYGNGRVMERLHRVVLEAPEGVEVDHINNDGLDCRRENLRLATRGQQNQNQRSRRAGGLKGVWRVKGKPNLTRPWRAELKCAGRRFRLGSFATEDEAARAYDRKAVELFGPFARLNYPVGDETRGELA